MSSNGVNGDGQNINTKWFSEGVSVVVFEFKYKQFLFEQCKTLKVKGLTLLMLVVILGVSLEDRGKCNMVDLMPSMCLACLDWYCVYQHISSHYLAIRYKYHVQ